MAISTTGKTASAFAAEMNARLDVVEGALDFLGAPVADQASGAGAVLADILRDPWAGEGGADSIAFETDTPTILTGAVESGRLVVRLGSGQMVDGAEYAGTWRAFKGSLVKTITQRFAGINETGGLTGIDLTWSTTHHPWGEWRFDVDPIVVRPASGAVVVDLPITRDRAPLDFVQYQVEIVGVYAGANNRWSYHPTWTQEDTLYEFNRHIIMALPGMRQFYAEDDLTDLRPAQIVLQDPQEGEEWLVRLYSNGTYNSEGVNNTSRGGELNCEIPLIISSTASIKPVLNEGTAHLPAEVMTGDYRGGRPLTHVFDPRDAEFVRGFEALDNDSRVGGKDSIATQYYNNRDFRRHEGVAEQGYHNNPIDDPETLVAPLLPTMYFDEDDGHLCLRGRKQDAVRLPIDLDPSRESGTLPYAMAGVHRNGAGMFFGGLIEFDSAAFNNGASINALWLEARVLATGSEGVPRTWAGKPEIDGNENEYGDSRDSRVTILYNSPGHVSFPTQDYISDPLQVQKQARYGRFAYRFERRRLGIHRFADADGKWWLAIWVNGRPRALMADAGMGPTSRQPHLGWYWLANVTAGSLGADATTADWTKEVGQNIYGVYIYENAAERALSGRPAGPAPMTPWPRGIEVLNDQFRHKRNGGLAELPLALPALTQKTYMAYPVGGVFPYTNLRMDAVDWASYDPVTNLLTLANVPQGPSTLTFRYADATGVDEAYEIAVEGEGPTYDFEGAEVGALPSGISVLDGTAAVEASTTFGSTKALRVAGTVALAETTAPAVQTLSFDFVHRLNSALIVQLAQDTTAIITDTVLYVGDMAFAPSNGTVPNGLQDGQAYRFKVKYTRGGAVEVSVAQGSQTVASHFAFRSVPVGDIRIFVQGEGGTLIDNVLLE